MTKDLKDAKDLKDTDKMVAYPHLQFLPTFTRHLKCFLYLFIIEIALEQEMLFMPTISAFYGILIQMFWRDHAPPHFHALYAEYEVLIEIKTLEIIRGNMPKRALALILEWASEHRQELLEDWALCEKNQTPKKISPLQ